MNLAKLSVTRPVAVTMRIAALVLLGFVCFYRLPVDLLPAVSLPTVAVITQWPNVAPEELETQITRPIEQAVNSAPNIYQVSSSTVTGVSTVRVQFNWGTDIGQGAVDVLQLVERARQKFPTDPTLQTPIVYKYDPSQLPIMIYGVSGEADPVKLRTLLDNTISPILSSANGVASAVATGGLQRALIIDVDPDKLRAYHLTLEQISKRIIEENIDLPAGIAKESSTEFTIRALGEFTSPDDAAKIPVGVYNSQLVSLGQVASVRDSHQETRIYTRLNGTPAAGMIIVKQSGANTVQAAENLREKLKTVQRLYPNLQWKLAYDQSGFIQASVDDVKNSALIGGSLAIIILLFFLRSFRSTLVVALSIPISIISTFALFYFCGFSLNTISLSGLSLATGLIVDDAVVVLENIFRHIERDKLRPAEAAVTGAAEITSAVVSSTITVMIVFLPLLLLKGQSGQLFTQFALVVIFSIAVSLLDATTVVPMLASRLIKTEEIEADHERHEAHKHETETHLAGAHVTSTAPKASLVTRLFDWFGDRLDALDTSYHNGLKWALRHRPVIIIGAIVISGASFLLVPLIGTEILPQTDSGNINVLIKMPVGTALSVTDATMKQVEKVLIDNPNVETVFSVAGSTLSLRGTSTSLTAYQGAATVKLKDVRKQSTQQVILDVQKKLAHLPGARAIVTPYDLVTQILTGGASNLEFDIYGDDLTQLAQLANQVLSQGRQIPGFESADLGTQDATPELRWKVDRQKMLQLGVTFNDIANALNGATNGTLSSYYQENGFQYPIYVQVPEKQRKSVDELLSLPITPSARPANSTETSTIELRQVAQPIYAVGPNEITRQNNQRYISISGLVTGRPQSEVQTEMTTLLNRTQFPTGTYWGLGVNQQRQAQEFSGLGVSVLLAIALIYMLLAAQFESFVYPLTILMSVPLCAIGVVLALFLTGRAFGLTAFIGLLLLIGIVVKNGILLVDYTNQLRGRGLERDDAVLTASPTRLRPILMTSSAAILGMVPLALAIGKGSETQAPLATAVIGGLTTSTLLTLFVVPVAYTLFDDLGRFFRKDKRDLAAPNLVEPSVEAIERNPSRDSKRDDDPGSDHSDRKDDGQTNP
jgi:HAE1 family hydrophobic/amphiphilic exporter-1